MRVGIIRGSMPLRNGGRKFRKGQVIFAYFYLRGHGYIKEISCLKSTCNDFELTKMHSRCARINLAR